MSGYGAYYYVFGDAGSIKLAIGQRLVKMFGLRLFVAEDYCSIAQAEKLKKGEPLSLAETHAWMRSMAETLAKAGGGILVLPMLDETQYNPLTVNTPHYFIYAVDGPAQPCHRPGSYRLGNLNTLNSDMTDMERAFYVADMAAAKKAK